MELHEYAAREVSALLDRVVSEAEKRAHTLIDVSRQEHDDALAMLRAQLAAQNLALEAQVHEKEQLAVSATKMRSQLEDLRREFQAKSDELQTMSCELETTTRELETTTRDLETTSRELETTTRDLETTSRELETTSRDLQTMSR